MIGLTHDNTDADGLREIGEQVHIQYYYGQFGHVLKVEFYDFHLFKHAPVQVPVLIIDLSIVKEPSIENSRQVNIAKALLAGIERRW